MRSDRANVIAIMCLVFLTGVFAVPRAAGQRLSTPSSQALTLPKAFQGFRRRPSPELLFLASEEGRAYLLATHHPLAQAAIAAFGEPSKTTHVPEAWLQAAAMSHADSANPPATASCSTSAGTRFNLEPRANAVPQSATFADFLFGRVGPNEDLIVQAGNDWRGNLAPPVNWDGNVSGYYVHRSTTADCSVQFEGGLPTFASNGNTEMGAGGTVVAADPVRDVVYMADIRFAGTGGVGLFKATASNLLSTTACPNGTHTQEQATSCWGATPPVLLFPQPSFNAVSDEPQIAVDERSTGTGAGDLYVANLQFLFSTQTTQILLVACTSTLNCTSNPVAVSPAFPAISDPFMKVRTDGVITLSYVVTNTDGTDSIFFATCTPAGAPNPPVCGTPVLAQNVAVPFSSLAVTFPLIGVEQTVQTTPKHATRAESGGKFTTFLIYGDCANVSFSICMTAEIVMTFSTDGGNTWSTPVSIDNNPGHHFYESITADSSKGIINLAYLSTDGDPFNHETRVLRNQIMPGRTTVGTAQLVTTIFDPLDGDPQSLGFFNGQPVTGVVARGNGATGPSRLYTSLTSTTVFGNYEGQPEPEQNNSISLFSY